jgi:hypothetical protein
VDSLERSGTIAANLAGGPKETGPSGACWSRFRLGCRGGRHDWLTARPANGSWTFSPRPGANGTLPACHRNQTTAGSMSCLNKVLGGQLVSGPVCVHQRRENQQHPHWNSIGIFFQNAAALAGFFGVLHFARTTGCRMAAGLVNRSKSHDLRFRFIRWLHKIRSVGCGCY